MKKTNLKFKIATLTLLATVVDSIAWAESEKSNVPVYQFGTAPAPEFSKEQTGTTFTLPEGTAKTSEQLSSESTDKGEASYLGYFGYPRYQLGAFYTPVFSGFRQTYNNLPLNFSTSSFTSGSIVGRILLSPELSGEVEYSHTEVAVVGKDLGTYKILDSKQSVDSLLGKFSYCQSMSRYANRLCYSTILGSDSYASLDFTTATSIKINTIKDFVFGLGFSLEREMASFGSLSTGIEYLYGLQTGQDTHLGVDSDNKLKVTSDFKFSNSQNLNFFSLGLSYEYRQAKFHGTSGTFTDNWETKSSNFALRAGYTWTWSRLP